MELEFINIYFIVETTTCSTYIGAMLACNLTGLASGQDYEISLRGIYSSGSFSQYGTVTTLTTSK